MNADISRICVVGLIGALLGFGWTKLNRRVYGDSLSPFNLLLWFWLLPILLRAMNLSWLENSWGLDSILALSLVTLELAAISLLPVFQGVRLPALPEGAGRWREMVQHLNTRKASWGLHGSFISLLAVSLYVDFLSNPAGFLLISAVTGNLTLEDASLYGWGKTQGRTAFTTILLTFAWLLPPLASLYYLRLSAARSFFKKTLFAFAAATPMLLGMVKLSKTDTMIGFLALLVPAYYSRQVLGGGITAIKSRSRWAWLSIAAATCTVAFIMFYTTAVFRVGESSVDTSFMLDWTQFKITGGGMFAVLGSYIYAYSALNFENFARFMSTSDGSMHPGISFLRPFLSIVMQGQLADNTLHKIDFNTVTSGLIAGTFLSEVYAELGWFGLVIAPITYALLVNFLYWRFRRKPTLSRFLLYSNFVFCWTFMFFANAFATLLFYTNILLIILFCRFVNTGHTIPAAEGREHAA